MTGGICVCADHEADCTPWCPADIQPVSLVIDVMGNVQLIQLPVFYQHISFIVYDDGCVFIKTGIRNKIRINS